MKELQIVYKNISELNPYENNPRFNDDAVEYVANSIKEFGFKNPIILDNNNVIVCGHTRYKAAKKLEIQCVVKDYADLDFYYAHKDLDVDYIIFRPVESTQAQYYKNKNNVALILDKLERIQCRDKRVVINYKFNRIGYIPRECISNFAQIALDEQGNVMYCCHKPYEIVGHITEKDILKKKLQYKTNMSKCDVPCRLTGCNYLLDKAKEHTSDSMFI